MKIYELSIAREHVLEKWQIDNVNIARDVFKQKISDKNNAIRTRVLENHTVVSEKYYGEDPDWAAMDDEWNEAEDDINSPFEFWDVYTINPATKEKESICSCSSETSAIDWILFKRYSGDSNIYLIEHS